MCEYMPESLLHKYTERLLIIYKIHCVIDVAIPWNELGVHWFIKTTDYINIYKMTNITKSVIYEKPIFIKW